MSILLQIITELGFEITPLCHLKPSESTLKKLEIPTMHQWTKLIEGEKGLTFAQAVAISKWLNVPISRLTELSIEKSKTDKLKLHDNE